MFNSSNRYVTRGVDSNVPLYPQTSESGRKERRDKGLRSSHSHWRERSHSAEPSQFGKYHGEPRKPSCKRTEPRQKPHEPLLPNGEQGFFGGTQPQKAQDHGGACGHLVRQPTRKLRSRSALQRQPLPYAEPPRNLYKGNNRVSAFPIWRALGRQAERASRRPAEKLHSALLGAQSACKASQDCKRKSTANREPQVRDENLAFTARVHR